MKRAKIIVSVGIIFMTAILLVFTRKNIINDEKQNWLSVKSVPFSGYICGYEDTQTFIQLPLFLPKNNMISLNDVTNIHLHGEYNSLACSDYRLSGFKDFEDTDYKLTTLSFRVKLSGKGKNLYDYIAIILKDGTEINYKLGDIEIIVSGYKDDEELSMTEFWVSQAQADRLIMSYINNTDSDIALTDFSYPEQIYDKISIKKYNEFDLKKSEEGTVIPAGGEKTFFVTFEMNDKYEKLGDFFFYMLPFVYYTVNGVERKMPSQTQATICQSPFTKEFVLSLMENKD